MTHSSGGLPAPLELTEHEFQLFRRLLEEEVGISLQASEKNLVANRLRQKVLSLNLSTYLELYRKIADGRGRVGYLADLVDALTTRKTDFFRNLHQMDHFRQVLIPRLVSRLRDGTRRHVSIWSAGCSTGEEPYSLSVLIHESVPFGLAQSFSILATDVSPAAIAEATRGVYPQRRLEEMPQDLVTRHFDSVENGTLLKVKSSLRNRVTFQEHNLKSGPWTMEPFDVIFCRNVIIYFSPEFQMQLSRRFLKQLKPGGYLYIGHSESLQHQDVGFEFEAPGVYRIP